MPGIEILGSKYHIHSVNTNLNAWNGNIGVKIRFSDNFLTTN